MSACEQSKSQSVLQHGESVKKYLFDLLDHLRTGKELEYSWRLPDWVYTYKELLLSNIVSNDILEMYTVYHDIGKPFCLVIDDVGKRHFPNHAQVSYDVFNSVFSCHMAADLILHDMDIHLLKSDGIEDFCKHPNAITSLIVGISELHSNAHMFGGIETDSFKIKLKSITKNGKKILGIIFDTLK